MVCLPLRVGTWKRWLGWHRSSVSPLRQRGHLLQRGAGCALRK